MFLSSDLGPRSQGWGQVESLSAAHFHTPFGKIHIFFIPMKNVVIVLTIFFTFSYLTKYTINSTSTLLPFKKCHTLYSTPSGSSTEAQQEAPFGCDHLHQLPWTAWVTVWVMAEPGAGVCTQRCLEAPGEKRIPVPNPVRNGSFPCLSHHHHLLSSAKICKQKSHSSFTFHAQLSCWLWR